MAARKAEETAAPENSVGLEETFDADALNESLSKLYGELGIGDNGESNVYVYKFVENGKEARIWEGSPDDYDLNKLSRRFGSGDYRVKVYVRGDSGRFVLRGNKVFCMLLDPIEEVKAQQIVSGAPVAVAAPAFDPMAIANAITTAIAAAMPKPAPQVDPLQQMAQLAGIMKTMMPNQAPQQSPMDMLGVMRMTIEMMNLAKGERDPIESGVNATTTDVFMKMIDKFGAPIAGLLAQQTTPGMAALPAPPTTGEAPPVPFPSGTTTAETATITPEVSQPAQPPQTPEQEQQMLAQMRLKAGLGFLCMQAKADNDPGTYAEMAIDNVPPDALKTICESPNYLDELAKFEPDVKNHAQWFADLRECIIEVLTADAENNSEGLSSPEPKKIE